MEKEDRLRILRKHTLWFIDQDSTTIVLRPRSEQRGPGGGILRSRLGSRAPQKVKLIHQGGNGISNGEGGQDRKYDYVIVLPYDAQVEIGDIFYLEGNTFVISSKDPENGYEKKVYARQHGISPTDG